ncbi:hypothetical protein BC937DRAFT_93921 [Endogone sp. FLAS-F59071]|nr:hypothetical protein BC937DRAFT_93921 [Endogone sp. FLAS-F59071]|eukprot:RUS14375.1 hypothetical protein BC937DRAFT_93921 [Endogone sp. FLAS-F59071]
MRTGLVTGLCPLAVFFAFRYVNASSSPSTPAHPCATSSDTVRFVSVSKNIGSAPFWSKSSAMGKCACRSGVPRGTLREGWERKGEATGRRRAMCKAWRGVYSVEDAEAHDAHSSGSEMTEFIDNGRVCLFGGEMEVSESAASSTLWSTLWLSLAPKMGDMGGEVNEGDDSTGATGFAAFTSAPRAIACIANGISLLSTAHRSISVADAEPAMAKIDRSTNCRSTYLALMNVRFTSRGSLGHGLERRFSVSTASGDDEFKSCNSVSLLGSGDVITTAGGVTGGVCLWSFASHIQFDRSLPIERIKSTRSGVYEELSRVSDRTLEICVPKLR